MRRKLIICNRNYHVASSHPFIPAGAAKSGGLDTVKTNVLSPKNQVIVNKLSNVPYISPAHLAHPFVGVTLNNIEMCHCNLYRLSQLLYLIS